MNFSSQTSPPAPVQSLLKTNTGSLLDSLDTETQARVLEQRFIKQPIIYGITSEIVRVQNQLKQIANFDMGIGCFIRVKRSKGRGGCSKLGPMGTVSGTNGHCIITLGGKRWLESYLACIWFLGELPDTTYFEIDHIDGNTINNHPANLRVVTRTINCRNTRKPSHNTSGYTGVSYRKDINRYRAYIKIDQKQISIGNFSTAYEAHEARQEWLAAHPELGFTTRHGT